MPDSRKTGVSATWMMWATGSSADPPRPRPTVGTTLGSRRAKSRAVEAYRGRGFAPSRGGGYRKSRPPRAGRERGHYHDTSVAGNRLPCGVALADGGVIPRGVGAVPGLGGVRRAIGIGIIIDTVVRPQISVGTPPPAIPPIMPAAVPLAAIAAAAQHDGIAARPLAGAAGMEAIHSRAKRCLGTNAAGKVAADKSPSGQSAATKSAIANAARVKAASMQTGNAAAVETAPAAVETASAAVETAASATVEPAAATAARRGVSETRCRQCRRK